MVREIGARVRTYHGSPGVYGTIIAEAAPGIDGGERVLIQWDMPEGGTRESRWNPNVLVAWDAPRDEDPPYVLLLDHQGKRAWLTARGVKVTPSSITAEVLDVEITRGEVSSTVLLNLFW